MRKERRPLFASWAHGVCLSAAFVVAALVASWLQAAVCAVVWPPGLEERITAPPNFIRRATTGELVPYLTVVDRRREVWWIPPVWEPDAWERLGLAAVFSFSEPTYGLPVWRVRDDTGEVIFSGQSPVTAAPPDVDLSKFTPRLEFSRFSAERSGFPFAAWSTFYDAPFTRVPTLIAGIDTGLPRWSPRPSAAALASGLDPASVLPSDRTPEGGVEIVAARYPIPTRAIPVVPRIPQALANGVFTLAAGWGVWWLVKRMRADRRELRGRCGGCGYPRPTGGGGPGGAGRESPQTCPECGCTARVVVRPLLGGRRLGVAWVRRG